MTQIAVGANVRWKSHVGPTYEGTVVAGPDAGGYYDLVTGTGAVAHIHRSLIDITSTPATPPEPDVTPEQAAAARDIRARQLANRLTTDAIMSLYAGMREDRREALLDGQELGQTVVDELRGRAADLIVEEATALQAAMHAQITDRAGRG